MFSIKFSVLVAKHHIQGSTSPQTTSQRGLDSIEVDFPALLPSCPGLLATTTTCVQSNFPSRQVKEHSMEALVANSSMAIAVEGVSTRDTHNTR